MVILSIFTLTFMVPLGLSYTVSGMVGSFMGQRKVKDAIRYGKVAYAYGMGFMVIICCLTFSQHSRIVKMFQGDAQQITKLNYCMVFIYIIIML